MLLHSECILFDRRNPLPSLVGSMEEESILNPWPNWSSGMHLNMREMWFPPYPSESQDWHFIGLVFTRPVFLFRTEQLAGGPLDFIINHSWISIFQKLASNTKQDFPFVTYLKRSTNGFLGHALFSHFILSMHIYNKCTFWQLEPHWKIFF